MTLILKRSDVQRIVRVAKWCEGLGGMDDVLTWGDWYESAALHMIGRMYDVIRIDLCRCPHCDAISSITARYCSQCAWDMSEQKTQFLGELRQQVEQVVDGLPNNERIDVLPSCGVYVYYHPTEEYKIGQAENIPRRMLKHECSAPSLELLHVIETSDLDWTERFIHKRYAHRRRASNHEYFDLTYGDLAWLFSVKVLNPPTTLDAQMSLLDLL